eukprot:9819338-Alexandrium_andersonii.AAC.1
MLAGIFDQLSGEPATLSILRPLRMLNGAVRERWSLPVHALNAALLGTGTLGQSANSELTA